MNFATLDLNLLRVFDAMFAEQSATRAGKRLGLSQPAVSAALNRLRHAVGDPLFVRQGSRMVPTTKALAICEPVRESLATVEQALTGIASFDARNAQRTFRLFGSDYLAGILMPSLAAKIAREAPGVVLQLIDNGRGEMAAQLSDHAVHLALEPAMEVPDWISQNLALQSSVSVVAAAENKEIARHGLKPHTRFPLDLFCALPQAFSSPNGTLTGLVDHALAGVGRKRQVQLTLPQFHSVAVAVAQGELIATLPTAIATKYAPQLGLNVYDPPIDIPRVNLMMFWHRRHDADEAHKWLRTKVKSALSPFDESGNSPEA